MSTIQIASLFFTLFFMHVGIVIGFVRVIRRLDTIDQQLDIIRRKP